MKTLLLYWSLMVIMLIAGCEKSPIIELGDDENSDVGLLNEPFWEQVYEGWCNEIYIDPTSGNILVGTYYDDTTAAIIKSSDNGNTWNEIFSSRQGISYLATSPEGDIYAWPFRSLDNGLTWEKMRGNVIDMDFTSRGNIFASMYYFNSDRVLKIELFQSSDKGSTWTKVESFNTGEYNHIHLDIDREDRIVVGSDSGICYSTDNGITWSDICLNKLVLSLAVNSMGHIFAGYDTEIFIANSFRDYRLATSTDDGTTWTSQEIKDDGNSTAAIDQIVIGPHNEILVNGITRTYLSEDNGNTWAVFGKEIHGEVIPDFTGFTGIGISSNGHILVSATSGIWRSVEPLEGY